jgi:hypothetical protein
MNTSGNSCFKTSNNKFQECPARMDDARHFTDYRPSNFINDLIRSDNNISNSLQFRQFLQQNGNALMEKNRQIACLTNCCGPCPITKEGFEPGTMLSEQYMFVTDGRTTKMVLNDVNGIGTGRMYYTQPDEECKQLPSAWPAPQNVNMCATPMDRFNYLGEVDATPLRQAVIGGGTMVNVGPNMMAQ